MKLPHKTLERNLFKSRYRYVIGVDEVGMGCLAGPVVVCAVAMTAAFYNKTHKNLRWLRESKLLQARQREEYAKQLMAGKDIKFQVTYAYPKTIDKLNIYNATRLAMRRAVLRLVNSKSEIRSQKQNQKITNLKSQTVSNFKNSNLEFVSKFVLHTSDFKTMILVDGPHKIPKLNFEQLPIVKGDRKVFAIACASVIAKVLRDKLMRKYAKKYPDYGFEKHKGYGTKYHQFQLTRLGPSEIHRKSFAPVAKLL